MLEYKDLIAYFQKGCKKREDFRLGVEWEQFSYDLNTQKPLPYYGKTSILALLEYLITHFNWKPYTEKDIIIALTRHNKHGNTQHLSLEPGGQIELSGALQPSINDVKKELFAFDYELKQAGQALNIGFTPQGFSHQWSLDDFHTMPKQRYDIMKHYMPKTGNLGLDMMFRTCTMQLNIDYESEMDMVKKMRVSMALQPLATALFAHSPYKHYLSYRSHIWTDTDHNRTGILEFVFDPDFGFQHYTDYILNMPMYFIKRGDHYIDTTGLSFKDFMDGKCPAYPNEYPTLSDWNDHVGTAFPEVRLKQFIEMRGADSGAPERVIQMVEFWLDIFKTRERLDYFHEMVLSWPVSDIKAMRHNVTTQGMNTHTPDGRSFKDFYKDEH